MANAVSSVDVPLSLFSGWNTELSPPDQPEGASPANNDVVFTPGAVATRPGLNRVFAIPISALGPVSYQKSFVAADGIKKNLYLTQTDGKLWVENVTNAPGVATLLFQTAGATYASSCTADYREYIALSDGVHGKDVPIQYDGTNLWRVTQDGPGAAPIVQSVALPNSTLVASTAVPVAIDHVTAGGPYVVAGVTYYSLLSIELTGLSSAFSLGEFVTISGNAVGAFNISGTIFSLGQTMTNTFLSIAYNGTTPGTGLGGTISGPAATLSRSFNTVTGSTSTAHSLQVGYLVQISGVPASTVGTSISSIVINNQDNPGVATVTTATTHGLLPQNRVNLLNVPSTTVGGGISAIARNAQIVTVTTATPHGIQQGATVLIAGVTDPTYDGQFAVLAVPSTTTFTYYQFDADGTSTAGTVSYVWPLANVDPSINYFTVIDAPSPTSFTVSISYTNGTWTGGGTVTFGWDGKFFVTAVPTTTSFQYQQYGPDLQTTSVGTVTPFGQAAPGIHQVRQTFLLLSGAITRPSPWVSFIANGGQYLAVSGLAIGPANVQARILEFTGAGGAYFFYIPVPAQVNGIIVSTATQINDNTTTNILLDFSDNTLYAATATSIPGNNLANQVVLGPCSGFFSYASRLLPWGEYNKVQNLLNMGFDGGSVAATPGIPTGWTPLLGNGSTTLVPGRPSGFALQMTTWTNISDSGTVLQQGGYADANGAPILLPNTQYTVKLWLMADFVGINGANFVARFSSVSTGYASTAVINNASMSITGQWLQADFNLVTPATIPTDMTIQIEAIQTNVIRVLTVDEVELIYTDQPYLDNQSRISYAENFEGLDIETGVIGPEDDLSPIRNFGVIRQALYIVTGTGLHETQDNDQTEPSGWNVAQVADNCGAFSIAAIARNAQGIGSAGKDWMMWSGPDGAQIFTGQKPWKISQEIQSVWDSVSPTFVQQAWVKNNENAKLCFFGLPTQSSPTSHVANKVYVLDYRNIDGAAIAENPPIHISFSGKMIVSDLTRKWTVWGFPAFCGELMYRDTFSAPQMVFGSQNPTNGANVYILNPAQFHDDDFGTIGASYTTYFFVSHEMEQALQVGSHRHIYTLAQAFIAGVGTWTLTPLAAALSNPFPSSPAFPLSSDPHFDLDFGINVTTTRCAFTIQAQPLQGSQDNYFKLQKLVINMGIDPNAKVRGSAGGSF